MDFLRQTVSVERGLKEAWHGAGPYMAHMSLSFMAYSAISIYLHPLLAPIGTFATYPIHTIWARMTLEAGKTQKKYD